ncbi:SDR family NAD(P)-dependent oxidoreductase [Oenococcus oeni]
MKKTKNVIITGASSGMGFAAAELFSKHGWQVFAGARRLELMKELKKFGVETFFLDLSKDDSIETFFRQVLQKNDDIDVLINNAGYGEYGSLEDTPIEQARAQFQVNVFAAMQLTQLLLPFMRKKHKGRIINISSIAGFLYTPLGGWYDATKHALETLTDTLRLETETFGIQAILIEPGGTRSEWLETALKNARKNTPKNSIYYSLIDAFDKMFSPMSSKRSSQDLAELFYQAATVEHPKARYADGFSNRTVIWAFRHLPYSLTDMVIKKLMK